MGGQGDVHRHHRKSPNLHMSRPRVTGPAVPAARWARRPLTGRGLESQLDSTAVNDLFTVISHK